MRKHKILLILLIVSIPLVLVIASYLYQYEHICIDQTHLSCDGNCKCDGLECGPYITHPQHCMCEFCIEATDSGTRDYTIKETKDTIYTYNEENLLIDAYPIIILGF